MKDTDHTRLKDRKLLVVVAGPTGVGKSDLAFQLALHFKTAILSADSRQIYQGLKIGTAKPDEIILKRVKHFFIDHIPVGKPYSAAQFEREGLEVLEKLYKKTDIALLCGGTGLYIKALCEGLDPIPDVSLSTRKEIETQFKKNGLAWLQSEVHRLDPEYFEIADTQNPRRLIRALSVCRVTGKSFSGFLSDTRKKRSFSTVPILLSLDRKILYDKLDRRVDEMISEGWETEAKKWYPYREQAGLQTVGYNEWFSYFDGYISRDQAIEKIKINTRRYAKRQITWFKKYGDWKEFHPDEYETIVAFIDSFK